MEDLVTEKANRFDDVCKLIAVRNARLMEVQQLDNQILNIMMFDETKNSFPKCDLPKLDDDHSL